MLIDIRLPRTLLAGLIGASLAIAGAMMQGLFRNPLADPGVLGLSGGAAVGAVIAVSAVTLPEASIVRWQAMAARSCPARSEHMSDDSWCGSMGTTRSGK